MNKPTETRKLLGYKVIVQRLSGEWIDWSGHIYDVYPKAMKEVYSHDFGNYKEVKIVEVHEVELQVHSHKPEPRKIVPKRYRISLSKVEMVEDSLGGWIKKTDYNEVQNMLAELILTLDTPGRPTLEQTVLHAKRYIK